MNRSQLDGIIDAATRAGIDVDASQREALTRMTVVEDHMKTPEMYDEIEENGVLSFLVRYADVSFVNTLRRILLSDIPLVCFRTENESVNTCQITVNQSRLHNEILKQRLSCIPVHTVDLHTLPGKWEMVLDAHNETDSTLYVTSDMFRVRRTDQPDQFLPDDETRILFPPDPITGDFILFARLRPKERLSLVAGFSIATASDSAMFNAVSKCHFTAEVDAPQAAAVLEQRMKDWKASGMNATELTRNAHNFRALDQYRIVQPNVWRFHIQSVGVYDNLQLRSLALSRLRALATLYAVTPQVVPAPLIQLDNFIRNTITDEVSPLFNASLMLLWSSLRVK
jgi:hypothetical protein